MASPEQLLEKAKFGIEEDNGDSFWPLLEYADRLLVSAGFPPGRMPFIANKKYEMAQLLFEALEQGEAVKGNERIEREFSQIINDCLMNYGPESGKSLDDLIQEKPDHLGVIPRKDINEENSSVATSGSDIYGILQDTKALLGQALRNTGFGEADAANIAHAIMDDFQASSKRVGTLSDPQTIGAAIDLAGSVARVLCGPKAEFEVLAKISLPSKAPETWAERDRSRKETPIEFLRRVWGPYMEAGVLYQDDIKRLGDPDLVQAVRNYCIRHEMKAADVLPPPAKVRLERALAAAAPGSLEAAYYKQRLRSRRTSTVSKRRKRAPHP